MRIKSSNPYYHIAYWLFLTLVLTLIFGRSWNSSSSAFVFICLLLPIVLGTSYLFNYLLVPQYYLKKRLLKFGLYTFYTIVISLYLEVIVLMFSFIYLGDFSMSNIGPNATDSILLTVVMYLLVILGSILLMAKQIKENQQTILLLQTEKAKMQRSFLELTSNRKKIKIPYDTILYIESLADYIKIHTTDKEVTSKEKISSINDKLPETFVRIHRSFIINKQKLTSFSYNEVNIDQITLNIGRSYKKETMERLAH